jgi:H+-transporting ATPase
MQRVLSVSTVLGLIGVAETFGMLLIGKLLLNLDMGQIQSLIFLKLAVAGHLTLFVARTKRPFLSKPYPAPLVFWSAVGTKAMVTVLVAFGANLVAPLPWQVIGIVWAYCLAWIFIEDWAKLEVYRHLSLTGKRHQDFLEKVKGHLHPHRYVHN